MEHEDLLDASHDILALSTPVESPMTFSKRIIDRISTSSRRVTETVPNTQIPPTSVYTLYGRPVIILSDSIYSNLATFGNFRATLCINNSLWSCIYCCFFLAFYLTIVSLDVYALYNILSPLVLYFLL